MQTNRHYELIARAIRWVADHQPEQPDLALLASELNVSPHHLQRTFHSWAGVSPKQFLKSLTRDAALQRLAAGNSVLDTSISVGLSGPGRFLTSSRRRRRPGWSRYFPAARTGRCDFGCEAARSSSKSGRR